jgi:integrase
MKLSELITEYLDDLDLADASELQYGYTITYFLDFASDIDVNDLDPSVTDGYSKYLECEKKLAPATCRAYFWPVRGLVKLAFRRGYIDIRPENFKAPRALRRRGPIMQVVDFQKMLLTACDEAENGGDWRAVRNLAMLAFTGDTWCRRGGLLSLTFDRLELDSWRAVLHEKNDQEHDVQYGVHTAEFMRRWLAVRPEPERKRGSVWVTL